MKEVSTNFPTFHADCLFTVVPRTTFQTFVRVIGFLVVEKEIFVASNFHNLAWQANIGPMFVIVQKSDFTIIRRFKLSACCEDTSDFKYTLYCLVSF